MLVSSLDLASSGTCVAAPTTAAPTMCHIDDNRDRAAADVEDRGEQRIERAVAAVGDPRRQRRLAGQADHSVAGEVRGADIVRSPKNGSSGSARSVGSTTPTQSIAPSESTCTHRFSRPVSHARPSSTSERNHPADDDVGHGRRELLSGGHRAVHLQRADPNISRSRSVVSASSKRPPASPGQIGHHRDPVYPRALGIQLAQPPAGLVQWQRPRDCHARDQRVVDHDRHDAS